MNLQFFAKRDIQQVNAASSQVGIDRVAFGEYIHEMKAYYNMKANENFTYQQLLELAEELKKTIGGN